MPSPIERWVMNRLTLSDGISKIGMPARGGRSTLAPYRKLLAIRAAHKQNASLSGAQDFRALVRKCGLAPFDNYPEAVIIRWHVRYGKPIHRINHNLDEGDGQPDGVGLLDLDDAAATKDASSYSVSK